MRMRRDDMMSRCEMTSTSTHRAGFYLPFSNLNEEVYENTNLSEYNYYPIISRLKLPKLNTPLLFKELNLPSPAIYFATSTSNDNSNQAIIASQPINDTILTQDNLLREFLHTTRVPKVDLPFFTGGLIGLWSYDFGLELVDLPTNEASPKQYFFMPKEVIVYDNNLEILTTIMWVNCSEINDFTFPIISKRIKEIEDLAKNLVYEDTFSNNKALSDISSFTSNISDKEFCTIVEKAKEHIRLGEVFQVVLSRKWEKSSKAEPFAVFRQLCHINSSPYNFFLKLPELTLLGASPESQIKVNGNNVVVHPIAGTKPITGNKFLDLKVAQELITDEKELAEHTMLVDLSRNDLAKISKPNTIEVKDLFSLKYFSHVVHLVSTVKGTLKDEVDPLTAFTACFPAGTLSGAPKRKAMEIINELEPTPRGAYGGAVGYISFDGNIDASIIIRSAIYKEGKYSVQSGAGIIADSNPYQECQETLNKAKAVMTAILAMEEN